jgi:hypothetical protein
MTLAFGIGFANLSGEKIWLASRSQLMSEASISECVNFLTLEKFT